MHTRKHCGKTIRKVHNAYVKDDKGNYSYSSDGEMQDKDCWWRNGHSSWRVFDDQVKEDWWDITERLSSGKAQRIAGKNAIRHALEEMEEDREEAMKEMKEAAVFDNRGYRLEGDEDYYDYDDFDDWRYEYLDYDPYFFCDDDDLMFDTLVENY